jgi:hypothetical protein
MHTNVYGGGSWQLRGDSPLATSVDTGKVLDAEEAAQIC